MIDERLQKLEYKLLFAITVAGKSASFARNAMDRLDSIVHASTYGWFNSLYKYNIDELRDVVIEARMGNYNKLTRSFYDLVRSGLDLDICTVSDLESVHGIGFKTSRFWLLWTRDNERVAALDVHILRWLREQGYVVPNKTPQSRSAYLKIESIFISEADKRSITPCALDREIWLKNNISGIRE